MNPIPSLIKTMDNPFFIVSLSLISFPFLFSLFQRMNIILSYIILNIHNCNTSHCHALCFLMDQSLGVTDYTCYVRISIIGQEFGVTLFFCSKGRSCCYNILYQTRYYQICCSFCYQCSRTVPLITGML